MPLTTVTPGEYAVLADPVVAADTTYTPVQSCQQVTVAAGSTATARISYAPATTDPALPEERLLVSVDHGGHQAMGVDGVGRPP